MTILRLTAALIAAVAITFNGEAQTKTTTKTDMDRFIDDLMSKMTLEEKLGQLNLPSCPSEIVTGNEKCENILENIRAGKVGAILNTYGYDNILPYQKAAVEESRLGIPLLTGLDVIHGHEGNAVCHGERLGEVYRHKKRADKAGIRRHGDKVDVSER